MDTLNYNQLKKEFYDKQKKINRAKEREVILEVVKIRQEQKRREFNNKQRG